MHIYLSVLIYSLCSGAKIVKQFKQPINALEAYHIQRAAQRCQSRYKTCLKKVEIKRYEIGGHHINAVCE